MREDIKIRRIGEISSDGSVFIINRAIVEDTTSNLSTKNTDLVLRKIERDKKISHSHLLRQFSYKMNAKELREVLGILIKEGAISEIIEKSLLF